MSIIDLVDAGIPLDGRDQLQLTVSPAVGHAARALGSPTGVAIESFGQN